MNEPKTTNQNHLENSKSKGWVFLAIRKDLIAKRTDSYVLVKLAYGWSAIISAKFLRKKESDTHIFASCPYDYKITMRQTQYSLEHKQFDIVDEKTKFPKQIKWDLYVIEQQLKAGQDLKTILDYQDLNVDTEQPVPSDKLPF